MWDLGSPSPRSPGVPRAEFLGDLGISMAEGAQWTWGFLLLGVPGRVGYSHHWRNEWIWGFPWPEFLGAQRGFPPPGLFWGFRGGSQGWGCPGNWRRSPTTRSAWGVWGFQWLGLLGETDEGCMTWAASGICGLLGVCKGKSHGQGYLGLAGGVPKTGIYVRSGVLSSGQGWLCPGAGGMWSGRCPPPSLLPLPAVDGAWSEWTMWSNCTQGCEGVVVRQRHCQPPRDGGRPCAALPATAHATLEIGG